MVRISKRRILKAIDGSAGIITVIANRVGCSRLTIYERVEKDPDIKDALMQSKEQLIDVAESKLAEKINVGDLGSIKFYLQTQGKHRGYVERQEVEHSGEMAPVTINLIRDTDVSKNKKSNAKKQKSPESK
jgi:hypothetical protein